MENKQNLINMIGCKHSDMDKIFNIANGNVQMSSGSYYTDYTIFDDSKCIAIFDHKGNMKYFIGNV